MYKKFLNIFEVNNKKKLLTLIVSIVIILFIIGIINQISLSAPKSLKDSMGLVYTRISMKHIAFTIAGVISIYLVNFITFKMLNRGSKIIYILGLFLLILVLVIGVRVNGAKRWINIGPINLQPSEFAKIFLIITIASVMEYYQKKFPKRKLELFVSILIYSFVYVLFVLAGRSLSSSLQIILITGCMLWICPLIEKKYVVSLFSISSLFVVAMIVIEPYRLKRFVETSEQATLAIEAIKRGGLFGRGFGNGLSRNFYLPEIQTDYIFAGFTEEWGFLGAIFVIILFVLLIYYIFYSARFTKTIFQRYVVLGVGFMLANQVILHLLINVNLSPSTGVTLPFFSYGGSSTLTNFLGIALVIKAIVLMDEDLI